MPYKEPESEINIQCPCGLVKAFVNCANGLTSSVRFRSVPSFTVKSGELMKFFIVCGV